MVESIDRGDTRRLTVTITENGAATDPASLTLTVVAPDATTTTYTYLTGVVIVRDGIGVFHADLTLNQDGLWAYDWRATNPSQVQGGELIVGLPATEHPAAYLAARARIGVLTDATSDPVLDRDDLDALVAVARRVDTNDYAPSHAAWTPTYDVYAAAVAGWELKAGRAAGHYGIAEDGQSFSRQQVYDHCMRMARHYTRGGSVVRVGSVAGA